MLQFCRNKWIQSSWAPEHLKLAKIEEDWNKNNIRGNAECIRDILFGFKHIISVDYQKIYNGADMHGWIICNEFYNEYTYPNRDLGHHAVLVLLRGEFTNDFRIFERNEFGVDAVFVGVNDDSDATMIAMKYK